MVRAGYPDPTQFDPKSDHYDPDAQPRRAALVRGRHQARQTFASPVPLPVLRATPALRDMVLLRKGSRLSVQPVAAAEWKTIVAMGSKR